MRRNSLFALLQNRPVLQATSHRWMALVMLSLGAGAVLWPVAANGQICPVSEVQKLTLPPGPLNCNGGVGTVVAMAGDRALLGSSSAGTNCNSEGRVFAIDRINGQWQIVDTIV